MDNRQDTQEWKIAERAHTVMKEMIARYAGTPYGPILPSIGDFYNGMLLDLRKKKVEEQMEMVELYGTFPHAMKLGVELNEINFQIAKRDHQNP